MKLKYINRLCRDSGISYINNITPEQIRKEIGLTFGDDPAYTESLGFCLSKLEEGEDIVPESQWERIRQNIWTETMGRGQAEVFYRRELKKYHFLDPESQEAQEDRDDQILTEVEGSGNDDIEQDPPADTLLDTSDEISHSMSIESFAEDSDIIPDKGSETTEEDAEDKKQASSGEEVISVLDWFTTLVLLMIPPVNIVAIVMLLLGKDVPETKKNLVIAATMILIAVGIMTASVLIRGLLKA